MSDLLLQVGATKLVLSVALACVAWAVHRLLRHPGVAYPMWLLVLVVLLVPAFMSLSILPAGPGAEAGLVPAGVAEAPGGRGYDGASLLPWFATTGKRILVITWLLCTAALLGWTFARAARFRRRLGPVLEPAPAELQQQAVQIGARLGLARVPEIRTTDARISPMVWWTGGRVRVLIPNFLLAELTPAETRSILAHELAHVRRRDYVVRWLEWIACSAFWWNPAAWWARRQLRLAEEACCDALVPAASGTSPRSYANALLRVVDVVSASPPLRPPVLASAAGGAGHTGALERRLRMIVETNTSNTPRWLRRGAWTLAMFALPLGLVYCDRPESAAAPENDPMEAPADSDGSVQAGDSDDGATNADRRARRARVAAALRELRANVQAGEITREEAAERAAELRRRMAAVRGEASADRPNDTGSSDNHELPDWYTERVAQVQELLDSGEITEEEARERWEGLRSRLAASLAEGTRSRTEKSRK